MKFEEVMVTPEQATKWLGKNDANRKLRMTRVKALAKAMEEGKWQLTHQGIAIGKSGRLLDGQHRLRALVMYGKPLKMMVATGVSEDTFSVLDAGLTRKMHERLKSDAKRTAVVNTLLRYMRTSKEAIQEYEAQLALDIFDREFLLLESIPQATRNSKMTKATLMAAALLRLAETREDPERRALIMDAIEAAVAGKLHGATPVVLSLYKQVQEGVKSVLASEDQPAWLARGWIAFNPDNADVQKILIRDVMQPIAQMRKVFRAITEGVFDE